MKTFDLESCLSAIHGQFPAVRRQPVIGITGNYGEQNCKLGEGYYKQVIAAGGVPMIIPPSADPSAQSPIRLIFMRPIKNCSPTP